MRKAIKFFVVLLFLLFGTVLAIYFKTEEAPLSSGTSSAPESVHISSIFLSDKSIELDVGKQKSLQIPEITSLSIQWKSSDETVAIVEPNGLVTAVSAGNAVISAYYTQDIYAQTQVSVTDNLIQRTQNCIQSLASRAGGDGVFSAAEQLTEEAARCQGKRAADIHALMRQITAYASDKGNSGQLEAELAKCQDIFSADTVRTAAASCFALSETGSGKLVFSFIGDCTFGTLSGSDNAKNFPQVYENSGSLTYPFDRVRGIFSCDSKTVANVECTLTENTQHKNKKYVFRGKPEYAKIFSQSGIEIATIANNHSGDFFDGGTQDTQKNLAGEGIDVIADKQASDFIIQDTHIAMFACNIIENNFTDADMEKLCNRISEKKKTSDIVIVNIHWGIEREYVPYRQQIDWAHKMVDSGADLIVGHHTHTLQGIEEYNGKYIAYSLGNFSFGGNTGANYPETVIFRASFDCSGDTPRISGISVIPCKITSTGTSSNNYQPKICFGNEGRAVISELLQRSSKLKNGICEINSAKV